MGFIYCSLCNLASVEKLRNFTITKISQLANPMSFVLRNRENRDLGPFLGTCNASLISTSLVMKINKGIAC